MADLTVNVLIPSKHAEEGAALFGVMMEQIKRVHWSEGLLIPCFNIFACHNYEAGKEILSMVSHQRNTDMFVTFGKTIGTFDLEVPHNRALWKVIHLDNCQRPSGLVAFPSSASDWWAGEENFTRGVDTLFSAIKYVSNSILYGTVTTRDTMGVARWN